MKKRRTLLLSMIILCLFTVPSMAEAKVFNRGNPDIKEMALTFDDGYSKEKIYAIMDKLNKHKVKGTFFFVGSYMASNKEIVRDLEASGHMVVSHSYTHKDFTKNSSKVITGEIENTKIAYNKATGKKMLPYFRPPYGAYNDSVLATLGKNHDLYVVMWTIDTLDWKGLSPAQINQTVLNNAGNGKIVLMHTTAHVQTDKALDDMIVGLKNQGYDLVRIDEMFMKLPEEKRLKSADLMYYEWLDSSQKPSTNKTSSDLTSTESDQEKEANKEESLINLERDKEKIDKELSFIKRYLWRLVLSR